MSVQGVVTDHFHPMVYYKTWIHSTLISYHLFVLMEAFYIFHVLEPSFAENTFYPLGFISIPNISSRETNMETKPLVRHHKNHLNPFERGVIECYGRFALRASPLFNQGEIIVCPWVRLIYYNVGSAAGRTKEWEVKAPDKRHGERRGRGPWVAAAGWKWRRMRHERDTTRRAA